MAAAASKIDPKSNVVADLPISVQTRIAEAVSTIGYLPASLRGAITVLLFDMLSHHRLSVLKNHRFPDYRGGQKFIAASYRRYTKPRGDIAGKALDIVGESFLKTAKFSENKTEVPGRFKQLEFGERIAANSFMAMPINGGRATAGQWALLREKKLTMIRTKSGALLAFAPAKMTKAGQFRKGARTRLLFVLFKRRVQRPMLNFFARWNDIANRDTTAARFGKMLDNAVAAATLIGPKAVAAQARQTKLLKEVEARYSVQIAKDAEYAAKTFQKKENKATA